MARHTFPLLVAGSLLIVALTAIVAIQALLGGVTLPDPSENVLGKLTEAYDVVLAQPGPIYSWTDIPYHDNHNSWPFTAIEHVPGHFVVMGYCADGRSPSGMEAAGQYIFTDDGAFVGKQDVCRDTASIYNGCNEIGGCKAGWKLEPVDDSSFIRDLGMNDPERSAVRYTTAGTMADRLYFADLPHDQRPPGTPERFNSVAYANGIVAGVTKVTGGPAKTALFTASGFERLADIPCDTCQDKAAYYPLLGVGPYFIANSQEPWWKGPFTVYRMPSAAEIRAGQRPVPVEQLNFDIFIYARDALDPDRIAFLDTRGNLVYYEAGKDGLERKEESVVQGVTASADVPGWRPLAIAGDYVAYTTCAGSPAATGFASPGCILHVTKGGVPLSVEPIPHTGQIKSLAISPTGTILVGVALDSLSPDVPDDDNGHLYLYRIPGFGGSTPAPGTPGNYAPPIDPNDGEEYLTATYGGAGPGNGSGPGTGGPVSVSFVKDMITMPGYNEFYDMHVPLWSVEWLDSGHFAVASSACASQDDSGGLYVFTDRGNLVGKRDVCIDDGAGVSGHYWGVSPDMEPYRDNLFVKEQQYSLNRPPLLYRVNANSVELLARPFDGGDHDGNNILKVLNIAVANDRMIGTAERIYTEPGGQRVQENNLVVYGLPGMTLLESWPREGEHDIAPLTGIGNGMFIAMKTREPWSVGVYRITEVNAIEHVQTLFAESADSQLPPYSRDHTANRIALFMKDPWPSNEGTIYTYDITDSGLDFVSERVAPRVIIRDGFGMNGFAIAGDYLAMSACDGEPTGYRNDRRCQWHLWRGDEKIEVPRLPDTLWPRGNSGPPERITGIVISPDGYVAVVNAYAARLYRIDGFTEGGT